MIVGFFRKDSNYSDAWCIQSIRKTMDKIGCTEQNIFAEPCLYLFLDQCRKKGVKIDEVVVSSVFDLVPFLDFKKEKKSITVAAITAVLDLKIPFHLDSLTDLFREKEQRGLLYKNATAAQKLAFVTLLQIENWISDHQAFLRPIG